MKGMLLRYVPRRARKPQAPNVLLRRHRPITRPDDPAAVCLACGGGEGSMRYEVAAGTQIGGHERQRHMTALAEPGWEARDVRLWIARFPYEGGVYEAIVHQWNDCMARACDILFEEAS